MFAVVHHRYKDTIVELYSNMSKRNVSISKMEFELMSVEFDYEMENEISVYKFNVYIFDYTYMNLNSIHIMLNENFKLINIILFIHR